MKIFTPTDAVDGCLMLFGLTISLQDIQSILSIIIIIIDILWIIGKFIIKFFKYIQDGKLDEEEKEDLKNELEKLEKEDLKNELEKLEKRKED